MKQLIRALAQWFTDGIYIITGNHDERLARVTKGQVTLQMLLEDEPATFSYINHMYLRSPSKDEYTLLAHQYRYRKVPVTLAQDIWAVETAPDDSRRKMHVIITHTHIEQTDWSPDGLWRCISMGCARDGKKTKYKQTRLGVFRQWIKGLIMIRNGYHHSLTELGTDWKEFLGPELYAVLGADV